MGLNNLLQFADVLESGYLISPMQGSLHISSGGPNFYGQADLAPPLHTPTSGPPPPPPAPSMAMQNDFVLGTPVPNRGTPDRFCQDEYRLMVAKLSINRFSNCNHCYGNFQSTCGWPFPSNRSIISSLFKFSAFLDLWYLTKCVIVSGTSCIINYSYHA